MVHSLMQSERNCCKIDTFRGDVTSGIIISPWFWKLIRFCFYQKYILVQNLTKRVVHEQKAYEKLLQENDEEERIWQEMAAFSENDVHHQYAIVFKYVFFPCLRRGLQTSLLRRFEGGKVVGHLLYSSIKSAKVAIKIVINKKLFW